MHDPRFTEPVIQGRPFARILPDGFALVLEGGGTRGFYSAGVLEAFMDAGVLFPYIIGVSAGAANALSYISGQAGRNRVIIEKYVGNPRYVSYRNLLRHRSLFGFDYILDTVPNRHLFWDRERFDAAGIRFLTGATDCLTGQTIWFEKSDLTPDFAIIQASCSVPFLSRTVNYQNKTLLDGGICSPIPIEKSLADGNQFHVVVLTRNRGYQKQPFKHKRLLKRGYPRYPKLAEAMLNRHEVYNRQLALCEQLEREGKALIIRPEEKLTVDKTSRDIKKLLALHDEGLREGAAAVEKINAVSLP